MNTRQVYTTNSIATAKSCVAAARRAGAGQDQVALIARPDVQMDAVPDQLKDAESTDVGPAAMRGALGGGGAGLLAGLIATSIPSAGVTLAGAGLIGVAGAALGTWSSALVGAAVPNRIQRQFEDRIEAGEVLVAVDTDTNNSEQVETALTSSGARRLDFESTMTLS